MSHAPLLVEIGCEEIPAGVGAGAAQWLLTQLAEAVGASPAEGSALCTPRRLIAHLPAVALRQADRSVTATGPAIAVARDSAGNWTQAAQGFARSQGVSPAELHTVDTAKGTYVAATQAIVGRPMAEVLAETVPRLLRQMPLPKRMRWGAEREPFVRPIHWLVVLHGNEAISCEFAGVVAGTTVGGHRFYHPAQDIQASADLAVHKAKLREAKVLADPAERRQVVLRGLQQLPAEVGATWRRDEATLDTVVHLVEWPAPLLGAFDPAFLAIPAEVIFTTLRENQKLFVLDTAPGQLSRYFVAVANTLAETSRANVAAGNARVVSARLADAQFFYREDTKHPLHSRVAVLDGRIFLAGLGSIGDKARRLAALATLFAPQLAPGEEATVARAALLCKADLSTRMVFEFPELQGTIGAYYAAADGESAQVAAAIRGHYQPRFAGDALPATGPGQALALADKLDTIVGCFALGLLPTGAQDPYSLRRAALGVLRILAASAGTLRLSAVVGAALVQLPVALQEKAGPALAGSVRAFLRGRLAAAHAVDFPVDSIEAVLEADFDAVATVAPRLQALQDLRGAADFAALAAAFKRVANLTRKSAETGDLGADFRRELCEKAEEHALASQIEAVGVVCRAACGAGDYAEALRALAHLRPAVDGFFDAVLVITDDATVRRNRLALLKMCSDLFAPIADFGKLQG